MITNLQRQILEFTRRESFHGTLREFIDSEIVDEEDALSSLRDLKRRHIVSMSPDLLNSWIGVTNYGWRMMGWNQS